MILLSCSFLLWSVFFFPLFPPDAMPEHSELIDGDPGLGVYWESKNSFIRNYARLYWRAGAVRVSCPVQLGGRASGMKPTSFKKSSKNGTGRSIGQAVACLVMAAAITIGGAGTTFLLASQPAGLTVEPTALQTEGRVTLPKFDHKSDRSEAKAESTQPEESASSQEQAAASTPAASVTKAENTAAAPAESVAPAAEPAVQPEATPADPMAGDASEIENENSFPHFLTETEALAAEDPMAAPEETAILPETEETAPVAATALLADAPEGALPSEVRPEIVTWEKLCEAIQASGKAYNMEMIQKAYELANNAHNGVCRRSGEPYICHPLAVARLVLDLGMDSESIAAALLHDVVEDTPTTLDDLKAAFGEEVALLVDGVTKLTKIQFSNIEELQAENLRKMLLAMSRDVRVMIIKLCDRLHNMRTGDAWPEQKRRDKARETMEVYAPIANRLGILNVKEELEDRSLHYLDPVGYSEISRMLSERAGEEFLIKVSGVIERRLVESGIEGATIKRRVKSIYGIYRKTIMQNKSFDEIYDIYAVRVILDSLAECYSTLGLIHDMYHPLPNRFKDYISTPKPNGYQSLHTTVIGHEGIPFEVQIRTRKMDEQAEYGVAAHWKYKEGREGHDKLDDRLAWVSQLLENQRLSEDSGNLLHDLKSDLLPEEVFAFTPKGDVINLPTGATCIDFAYAIHSAVGNSMIGAKVNNRIASYDAPLHNGDIVEILTSKSAKGPSRDWLNICQSNQARVKIKQWFKREKREENIVRGKASFEAELRHAGVDPDILQNTEVLPVILKKVSFECLDDMYAAIGYGGLTAAKAVGRIRDDLTKATRTLAPKPLARQNAPAVNSSGVIVEDIGSCMIKFSRCCTPVPGDEIIGFITKGYGVSVHRKDCPNARAALDPAQKGRWVKVTWAEAPDVMFSTSLEIEADDRDGLMLDVATILTSLRLRTSEMSARSVGGGTAIVCLRFGVHNLTELENVRTRLRGISGVHNVERGTE